jgi:hypothetical protein
MRRCQKCVKSGFAIFSGNFYKCYPQGKKWLGYLRMGICIKLLGGPAFCRSDGSAVHLPTRKSEALFAYLLERGGEPVSREVLSAHLWPYSG